MRGESTGIVYGGLKYQARCIADVKADADSTSFLAGTLSLKEENEVHLIRLSPSGKELVCDGLFYHPNEIWDLASCPFDPRIFSTVSAAGEKYEAIIWQIPELYGQSNSPQMEEVVSLKAHNSKIKRILWWPSGKHEKIISMDEENFFLWSLDCPNKAASVQSEESVGMLHYFSGGAWDPHDQNSFATICDSLIQCWDLRSMKKTNSIGYAHIRDIDYNPKRPHTILPRNLFNRFPSIHQHKVTADDEFGIHLWDFRMPNTYIKELPGHAHWTWAVRHNPHHEELILSSGTDSTVKLWHAPIAENEELTHEGLTDSPSRKAEPLLNSFNDYEDSVYGIAWSSRETTIFASLSYDGRVVVESVKPYLPRRL